MPANESLALLLVWNKGTGLAIFIFDLVQRIKAIPFVIERAQQITTTPLAFPLCSLSHLLPSNTTAAGALLDTWRNLRQ